MTVHKGPIVWECFGEIFEVEQSTTKFGLWLERLRFDMIRPCQYPITVLYSVKGLTFSDFVVYYFHMETLELIETRNIDGNSVAVFRVSTMEYDGSYSRKYRIVWDFGQYDLFGWPTDSDIQRVLTRY